MEAEEHVMEQVYTILIVALIVAVVAMALDY